MSNWKKHIVYRSKDAEDWNKAANLLKEAGAGHSAFESERSNRY